MRVAVPRESFPGESRVALVPGSIPLLVKAGLTVVVEQSAGESAGFLDDQYRDRGASVVAGRADAFDADVILQVRSGGANPEGIGYRRASAIGADGSARSPAVACSIEAMGARSPLR